MQMGQNNQGSIPDPDPDPVSCPECSVCFAPLNPDSNDSNDSVIIKLNCSHSFHEKCINEWRKRKESCPVCRCRIHGLPPLPRNEGDQGDQREPNDQGEGDQGEGDQGEPREFEQQIGQMLIHELFTVDILEMIQWYYEKYLAAVVRSSSSSSESTAAPAPSENDHDNDTLLYQEILTTMIEYHTGETEAPIYFAQIDIPRFEGPLRRRLVEGSLLRLKMEYICNRYGIPEYIYGNITFYETDDNMIRVRFGNHQAHHEIAQYLTM